MVAFVRPCFFFVTLVVFFCLFAGNSDANTLKHKHKTPKPILKTIKNSSTKVKESPLIISTKYRSQIVVTMPVSIAVDQELKSDGAKTTSADKSNDTAPAKTNAFVEFFRRLFAKNELQKPQETQLKVEESTVTTNETSVNQPENSNLEVVKNNETPVKKLESAKSEDASKEPSKMLFKSSSSKERFVTVADAKVADNRQPDKNKKSSSTKSSKKKHKHKRKSSKSTDSMVIADKKTSKSNTKSAVVDKTSGGIKPQDAKTEVEASNSTAKAIPVAVSSASSGNAVKIPQSSQQSAQASNVPASNMPNSNSSQQQQSVTATAPVPVTAPAIPPIADSEIVDSKAVQGGKVDYAQNISNPEVVTSAPVVAATKPQAQPQQNTSAVAPKSNLLLSIKFDGDSVLIDEQYKVLLANLVNEVKGSNKRLKIISYATPIDKKANSARRISLQRSIAVRSQMIGFGLSSVMINVHAAGDETNNDDLKNSANIYAID